MKMSNIKLENYQKTCSHGNGKMKPDVMKYICSPSNLREAEARVPAVQSKTLSVTSESQRGPLTVLANFCLFPLSFELCEMKNVKRFKC